MLRKDEKQTITTKDPLGQAEALTTLLRSIRGIEPPACLAVYGSWGIGKTTLLHSAKARLKDAGVQTVWFDPWPYERHQDVLGALLVSILDQLDIEAYRRKQLKDKVVSLLKAVVLITASKLPSIAALAAGHPVAATALGLGGLKPEDFAKYFVKDETLQDEVQIVRSKFKDIVDAALSDDKDRRLVVFLDDLDRCLPDHAVWLIEAVKLLLADDDTEARAVFVFGLDRLIIGEAIRARFPDSTLYTGENYLEKIFDLSLEAPLPKTDTDALKLFATEEELKTITQAFNTTSNGLIGVLGDPVFANPRIIQRTLNRLILLVGDTTNAGKARVARIQGATLSPGYMLAWVAGAERFRTFRHFFAQASEAELEALDHAVRASLGQASPSKSDAPMIPLNAIQGLVQTPGFTRFYTDKLNLKGGTTGDNILKHARKTSADKPATLLDFDHLMRQAGV